MPHALHPFSISSVTPMPLLFQSKEAKKPAAVLVSSNTFQLFCSRSAQTAQEEAEPQQHICAAKCIQRSKSKAVKQQYKHCTSVHLCQLLKNGLLHILIIFAQELWSITYSGVRTLFITPDIGQWCDSQLCCKLPLTWYWTNQKKVLLSYCWHLLPHAVKFLTSVVQKTEVEKQMRQYNHAV